MLEKGQITGTSRACLREPVSGGAEKNKTEAKATKRYKQPMPAVANYVYSYPIKKRRASWPSFLNTANI